MQIRDSIALVTGAGSGLGQATVDMLVAGGARVAAIDVARPTAAPQDAPDARGVLWLEADVSNAEAMEAAFARVTATWGVPTVLVNCAGVLGPARVFRTDSATGRVLPRDLESFRRVKVLSPADRRGDPLPAIVKRLQLAVSGDVAVAAQACRWPSS